MVFIYPRTVRFHETDAAGVVYFANVLTLCHEAYEASLAAAGVDVKGFFRGAQAAVPVVHASVDFRRPLFCGDAIAIHLIPQQTTENSFDITYQIYPDGIEAGGGRPLAQALTRHVCIQTEPRQRIPLTPALRHWLTQWSTPAPADG